MARILFIPLSDDLTDLSVFHPFEKLEENPGLLSELAASSFVSLLQETKNGAEKSEQPE